MTGSKNTYMLAASVAAILVFAGTAHAAKISGTISSTLSVTEDSDLVGDVTCQVTGAPCISIDAPQVTLRLNAFTMTGQGDPQTGCSGAATANEIGILVNSQIGVTVHGPGLVQQFRNTGVQLLLSTGVKVVGVTTSTNCASGILVAGGADNQFLRNVSIRNGNGSNPCGGI
jgi:hypothetical protein